jgi:hypothetical protein
MKSFIYLFCVLLILFFAGGACQFNNAGMQGNNNTNPQLGDTIPDNIGETDLLELLQGEWDSDSLSSIKLKIREHNIQFLDNRTVVEEGTLIIDSHCTLNICFDSLLLDNWCFIVEKQQVQQCYRVLHCGPDSLHFQAAGQEGQIERYHRVE